MKKIFITLAFWGVPLLGDIWLVEEEFIKIDKREVYETLRKEGVADSNQAQFGYYDSQDRAYIYLRPFASLTALEEYRQTIKQPELLNSILNFTLSTLQEFEPSLSSNFTGYLIETPYAAYQIYTIIPEAENAFRGKLQQIVIQHQKASFCWGVWKIIYGSELPKYVVGYFASDKKSLEAQLKNLKLEINDKWIRRHEEGRAILVPALSKND